MKYRLIQWSLTLMVFVFLAITVWLCGCQEYDKGRADVFAALEFAKNYTAEDPNIVAGVKADYEKLRADVKEVEDNLKDSGGDIDWEKVGVLGLAGLFGLYRRAAAKGSK